MPTNLYGPGDNFHAEDSHVLPALIRRFHDAMIHGQPSVTIWGSGDPLREFLHVDDLASACLHLMALPREELYKLVTPQCSHLNVGSGEEVRIGHLATMIAEAVGYEGHVAFDTSRPDGTPRKLLDSSKLRHLGWQPSISLQEGIERTVQHYLAAHATSPMDLASRGYVERPQLRL
jgi:nucleoside-diphosphate-sugar epimerase